LNKDTVDTRVVVEPTNLVKQLWLRNCVWKVDELAINAGLLWRLSVLSWNLDGYLHKPLGLL
jgi:hypothetical protein